MNPKAQHTNAASSEPNVEEFVEKAKRAFALRKYEQAVEHYATALEITCVLNYSRCLSGK